ncbi:hypothetical protein U1Q18_009950 [Sarracenia purpurea var. burkii]
MTLVDFNLGENGPQQEIAHNDEEEASDGEEAGEEVSEDDKDNIKNRCSEDSDEGSEEKVKTDDEEEIRVPSDACDKRGADSVAESSIAHVVKDEGEAIVSAAGSGAVLGCLLLFNGVNPVFTANASSVGSLVVRW